MDTETEFEQLGRMIKNGFDAADRRFDEVDTRFDAIDSKFDAVEKRFVSIERQLSGMQAEMQEQRQETAARFDVLQSAVGSVSRTLDDHEDRVCVFRSNVITDSGGR